MLVLEFHGFGGDACRARRIQMTMVLGMFGASVETTFVRHVKEASFTLNRSYPDTDALHFQNTKILKYIPPFMHSSLAFFRHVARTGASRATWARPHEHIPAASKRLIHTSRMSAPIRPSLVSSRSRLPYLIRSESSSANASKNNTSTQAPESRLEREQVPSYELTFTCNVCKTRSSHRLSKQGYHKGTVLISCPDCKNRHLISDHLKVG